MQRIFPKTVAASQNLFDRRLSVWLYLRLSWSLDVASFHKHWFKSWTIARDLEAMPEETWPTTTTETIEAAWTAETNDLVEMVWMPSMLRFFRLWSGLGAALVLLQDTPKLWLYLRLIEGTCCWDYLKNLSSYDLIDGKFLDLTSSYTDILTAEFSWCPTHLTRLLSIIWKRDSTWEPHEEKFEPASCFGAKDCEKKTLMKRRHRSSRAKASHGIGRVYARIEDGEFEFD